MDSDGWCWWYRKCAPGDTVLEGLEKEDERGGKACGRIRSRCRSGSGEGNRVAINNQGADGEIETRKFRSECYHDSGERLYT